MKVSSCFILSLLLLSGACQKPKNTQQTALPAPQAPLAPSQGQPQEKTVNHNTTPSPGPGIAALVGNLELEESKLDELVARRPRSAGLDSSALARLRRSLLEKLIEDALIDQSLSQRELSIDEGLLETELARLTEEAGGLEKHLEILQDSFQTPEEFKDSVRRNLVLTALLDKEEPIHISRDDLQNSYDNARKFPTSQTLEYKYSIILLRLPPDAAPAKKERAHSRLENLRSQIEKGLDFEEAAKKHSEHPSRHSGGQIDFSLVSEIEPSIRKGLAVLKPGQLSKVLNVTEGMAILRLEAQRRQETPSFESQKDLMALRLKTSRQRDRLKRFVSGLKNEYPILLAPQYR